MKCSLGEKSTIAITYDYGRLKRSSSSGPSIKYVTLEWVREGVTVCDRGRDQEHVTSHLYIFYHTYET